MIFDLPALPQAMARTGARAPSDAEPLLRARAAELEAAFLAEMLGHSGLGATPDSFGGGVGEDQFASFLRQEQARAMVRAGGIGLSEAIFQALAGRGDGGR